MNKKNTRPIMIVEDDNEIMSAMLDAFDALERKILKAENGKKAIEMLKKLRDDEYPCCIILDLMMPEMTGQEFIFHIQALGKVDLDSIPIVVSSASTIVDSLDVPRVTYKLKKPINLIDLDKINKTYY